MKHELLAPAGSLEAGYAALHYGADAVYLGLTKFSARAGAENFTPEELDEFTAYAHTLGRKVFVALNTVLTEAEARELPEIFAVLRRTRVDALIVQDLGVFYLAKKMLPGVELHASTQMAVHNAEGAKFLQRLGFKRVVLARELSLREIQAVAEAAPDLDLEVFVHGALCYSYSGQCLFSALEYGKSANRGRCVYPCRAEFAVEEENDNRGAREDRYGLVGNSDREKTGQRELVGNCDAGRTGQRGETEGYGADGPDWHGLAGGCGGLRSHLFSMKDLALEEAVLKIPALSLKIEGRKKSPLYVAAVTNYYRHILDGRKKDLKEAEDIRQIFSRPWCRFHFNGKDKNVVDAHFVGHRGLLIGKVGRVGRNRLGFKTSHAVARYDGVQIDAAGDEKPFGFGVKALFVNGKPAIEAAAGQYVELELPEEHPYLAVGAPVYLASSSAVKGKYAYQKPKPGAYRNRAELAVRVEIGADEVRAVCCGADGCAGTAEHIADGSAGANAERFAGVAAVMQGDFPPAKDTAKVEAAVREAFAKTGGTAFTVAALDIANSEARFVPVSVLNELRRGLLDKAAEAAKMAEEEAAVQMAESRQAVKTGGAEAVNECENIEPDAGGNCLATCATERQVKKLRLFRIGLETVETDWQACDMAETWFVLPQICRNTGRLAAVVQSLYDAGARKFVAENYYAFEMLRQYEGVQIGAGSFIYVMNHYATAALRDIGAAWATLALESPAENMAETAAKALVPTVQAVFAYPPLFTSAVCIRPNACKDCSRGVKRYRLKKDGRAFTAVSRDCQVQVFDTRPYEREAVPGIWAVIDERD